jgi:hypothetical protein
MTFTPSVTVVNRHHGASGEYIGRGTPLGNTVGDTRTVLSRDAAVDLYATWFQQEMARGYASPAYGEVQRLYKFALERPLSLVCSCKPLRCHGDVVCAYLCELLGIAAPVVAPPADPSPAPSQFGLF